MAASDYQQRIRDECTLPEGWDVHTLQGGSFEISAYGGEELSERILEVITGPQWTEIIIYHSEMPGRLEAAQLERSDDRLGEYSLIPSQVGVLQFHEEESAAAIEAIDALADLEVLDALAKERDFVKNESPLGVREAVDKVSDVDVSTVDDTTASI